MIGRTLGHYRIDARLGAGGMGVVYRAWDTRLERAVAVKVPAESLQADPAARARLLEEARAASALNHPGIGTIHEVGEADGMAYIVMEYVEGRPLSALIPPDGLAVETLLRYGTQIADALAHAHERGVVHRDLKSANVIITPEGRAKVLDFGLAKRLKETEAAELTRSMGTPSEAGAIVGTIAYMPPEVLRGSKADARSDIWALGVVLHEAAAGSLPFQGATSFDVSSAILRDSPRPPSQAPAALQAVIQRCLAKESGERYQRAGEIRAVLETMQPAAAPLLAAPLRPTPRRRWIWISIAAVLILVLGLAGEIMRRRAQGPVAPSGPRVSTGAPASKNSEANELFERAIHFMRVQNDLPRTLAMLEQALQLDPHFAEARGWYGFAHVILSESGFSNDPGLLYKAEGELRRALKDDPASSRVLTGLAAVYLHQGRKDLALIEIEKALRIKPDDPEAEIWLLNIHRFNGDNDAALAIAKRMIEREPLFFPPRMNLADILRTQGDTAGAIREMEKVLEQSPQSPFAFWYLSRAYRDAGDLAKARGILERARSVAGQNYMVRLAWALLLAHEGKREEALREMNEDVLKYATTASMWDAVELADMPCWGTPGKRWSGSTGPCAAATSAPNGSAAIRCWPTSETSRSSSRSWSRWITAASSGSRARGADDDEPQARSS